MPGARTALFALAFGGAEAARILVHLNSSLNSTPGADHWGSSDCRCVGIDEIEGTTEAIANAKKVDYPADLGAHCAAWDEKSHPSCPGEAWCKEKWCYVDPCKCKNLPALPKPSVYIPGAKYQGRPVHFSYATCGNTDKFTKEEQKAAQANIRHVCKAEVKAEVWGSENCRCVGIGGQSGVTKVDIKGKMVDFPADTGATCQPWESNRHPDCMGSNSSQQAAWCSQSWCYVDPCTCTLPAPPKLSSYVPGANFQGKPVYYSYTTCGGFDEYTAMIKDACVTQATEEACKKHPKCAWNGGMCLGKELVGVCDKSAAFVPQALIAFAVAVLGLVQ